MMAMESQDHKSNHESVERQSLEACVFDDIDVDKLSYHLILKLYFSA